MKVEKSTLINVVRGKGKTQGTFAHWQLALAYAKYLSPEFHMWANQVVKERFEEMADPEMGVTRSMERASKAYKKQGKTDEWIERRLQGMLSRKKFSSAVMKAGLDGYEVGHATNKIYLPMFGATAKNLKLINNTKNPRDCMDSLELAILAAAEEGVVKIVTENGVYKDDVLGICSECGDIMAKAKNQIKAKVKKAPVSNR